MSIMSDLGTKIGGEFKTHRLRIENVETGKVDKVAGKQLSSEDYTSLEKSKLAGIASGAQVNVPTDLSLGAATGTTLPLNSSTGTDVVLPAVTTSAAGLMSSTDKTKLDGIATGANNYSLPVATSTVIGGVELYSDTVQTVASNAVSTTASRTYGAQVNSSGQVVVNIPWTDTDTVYTHPITDGNLHVPATGTTNNGKVLTAGSTAGSFSWVTPASGVTDHTLLSNIGTNTHTQIDIALTRLANTSGTNTGDQTITLTGDVTGSGTGSFATTLANSGVTAGTYSKVTVDGKGRVTSGSTQTMEDIPDATFKRSVRAATTANITLSAPQTIDGIALVAGDRVLVKDQTTTSQNGIYVVAAGAWTRSLDADTSSKIASALVAVDSGTANGGKLFDNDFKTTDTLGTTAMLWSSNLDSGHLLASTSASIGAVAYNGTTAALGKFDGGTTTPTGTSRLNYGGYFYPTYLNLLGSADTATASSHVFVETASDGFVRPKTLANFKSEIFASPTLVTPNIGVATGTSFNSITGLSSTLPVMAGTATIGTATTVARADHVHPGDSSKLDKSGGVLTGALTAIREIKVAMAANDIDLASGNLFTKTIVGATTFTVSNILASGNANSFIFELTNGGSAIITWWAGMKWAGGTAPTLTAAGVDILGFYSHDGGTTWRGVLMAKDSK